MKTEIIRSSRRSYALEIRGDRLIVRAPLRSSEGDIRAFLEKHRDWIAVHAAKAQQQQAIADAVPKLTPEELRSLAARAAQVIPSRVAYFAPKVGVTYGRITIRAQRSRWGSCTAKGNLNFNCLLMLAPPEVLDSVVVHELCHRKFMDHSPRFYAQVLRVLPDYKARHDWLKQNGSLLMARIKP